MTVSDLFWKMVRDTVEQQSDAFKATKFNLETEWKNSFPRLRELDRYELFEKAKNEILDKVLELPTTVQPQEWENELLSRLWDQVSHHVVEHIFLPSAIKSDNQADFNTKVDIKLKQWADNMLPKLAAEVAKKMLLEKFSKVLVPYKEVIPETDNLDNLNLNQSKSPGKRHPRNTKIEDLYDHNENRDKIFDLLREEVLAEAIKRHNWDEEYYKTLRVIQLNALEDRVVQNQAEWNEAIKFIERSLGKRLEQTNRKIEEMVGKSTIGSYWNWHTNSKDQVLNRAISAELTPLLKNRDIVEAEHPNTLSEEEVLTIRKSLEMKNKVNLPESNQECHKFIRNMWYQLYRKQFLINKIQHCKGCNRLYHSYKNEIVLAPDNDLVMQMSNRSRNGKHRKGKHEMNERKNPHHGFSEVVLFWRISKMLEQSANAVRQQMMNYESKRLEKHVEEVLGRCLLNF